MLMSLLKPFAGIRENSRIVFFIWVVGALALFPLWGTARAQGAGARTPLAVQPSASPSPQPLFASSTHGYTIAFPPGWEQQATTGDTLADVRFIHVEPSLKGFYQVYEGAVTDNATTWYKNARARYEGEAARVPRISHMEFSALDPTSMGGQDAYSFGFVTVFRLGDAVATRIVFTPRHHGQRLDMHEIVVAGDVESMIKAQGDIDALLQSITFTAEQPGKKASGTAR